MDALDNIAETGEWWVHPWWDDPDRRVHFPCSKEALQQSAEVLKRHFDAAWAKDLATAPRFNTVFPNLCIGGSTSALSFIADLGKMIGTLELSNGLKQKITDLKGDKGDSAYLELEAAHVFADAGFQVEFPREGGQKSPDILVKFGDTPLAVECKRLRDEIWESWEEDLTRQLIFAVSSLQSDRQISVQVALNTRLTEVRVSEDKESELNTAFLQVIVRTIVAAVADTLTKNTPPFEFTLHELATVRVAYRDQGEYGSVTGMERGSPALFRRVFQNGFLRGCEQLPQGMPGMVIIYSKIAPSPQFFTTFFDAACEAQKERFSNVVAVVIGSRQTIFQSTAPIIYANRTTSYPHVERKIVQLFKTKFGGIVPDFSA